MDLTMDVGYNDLAKQAFGAIGTKFLRRVADCLALKEKKISWNKAGVAVSGEVSLYGMYDDNHGVCVYLSTPSYHGIMFRTIKHMKDYTGGNNQWIRPDGMTAEEVAEYIYSRTQGGN